jgi:pimeloyl-ACP methyl ester carboxylesterase
MLPASDGAWLTHSVTTPTGFLVRGLALVSPNSVIPVIVVPGVMGTNLRAKRAPRADDEENLRVDPGQQAWRPPNTHLGGLWDAFAWDMPTPRHRQRQLDPDTLEVDEGGPVHIPHGDGRLHVHPQLARQRGWGEVHAASYIALLCALETRLNETFERKRPDGGRQIRRHWREVMEIDPARWGVRRMKPLSEEELEKHARHVYPVYAVGYNWLECCEKSSLRLERKIVEIIDDWKRLKRRCEQVILVTHSMGGLVARACAKRIPDKIAGVIHGVMPALGAPVAYRRLACGTEAADFRSTLVAKILGETTRDTTPALATSIGALELLPNHLYPRPWLHVSVKRPPAHSRAQETVFDALHLPSEEQPDPYVLYRDLKPWFRLVDPALADPAGKFAKKEGGVERAIRQAITEAERFHKDCIGEYHHPNTYAFRGDDPGQRAFGRVRWVGRRVAGPNAVLTTANVSEGRLVRHDRDAGRLVHIDGDCAVLFKPDVPDAPGDGTVPFQPDSTLTDRLRLAFVTRGYDHQTACDNDDMLKLTLRLIVRIVQGLP